jgi:multiple sugar transport system substrate-binding protein
MNRKAVGALLAATVVLTTAACGDDAGKDATGDEVVTITVNAMPPATEEVNRKNFLADVAEFQAKYPKIKIEPHEGKIDPKTFSSRLAGGQLEDVFYVYFTDPANIIAKKQAADLTPYTKDFPVFGQIKPDLLKVFKDDKDRVYGVPWTNYSLGLLYNRQLFTQAGLDPDKPPATWAQVREAAKKIAALGPDYIGYGDYSKNNTGGWHFTAELYSRGGDVAVKDGESWKAGFNNATGKALLQDLKDMRWTDNSMGSKQALEYADLLTMMGSGKLGMYVAAPDNIPTIVKQYKGDYNNLGLGAIPDGKATLGGGEAFMINAKATPAKIKAGLTWLTWMYANPDRIESNDKRDADAKNPVGLPQPNLYVGDADKKQQEAHAKYANVPAKNYDAFLKATSTVPLKLEPPNAQQVYAVLDAVMLAVLTQKDADVAKLLGDAEKQVNQILATVPK